MQDDIDLSESFSKSCFISAVQLWEVLEEKLLAIYGEAGKPSQGLEIIYSFVLLGTTCISPVEQRRSFFFFFALPMSWEVPGSGTELTPQQQPQLL